VTGEDFENFCAWQAESPARRVSIEIGATPDGDLSRIRTYVYDADIMEGQKVRTVDDINLRAMAERRERKQLSQLLAKYGPLGGVDEQ
jgi:hypothetical protein